MQELKEKLEKLSGDCSVLLDGTFKLYPDVDVHVDAMYDALLTPDDTDSTTQVFLEAMMHGLLLILERQAEDQLEGVNSQPTCEQAASASNVPTTNIVSERDFGSLDLLLKMKPAASTKGLESLIMWTNNKTASWLRTLTDAEKTKLFHEARKDKKLEARYKERKEQVRKRRLEILKEKQKIKDQAEEKQYRKRVDCVKEMEDAAIWLDQKKMEECLHGVADAEASKLILKQMNYHRHVLKSKGDRGLFAKTSRDKALTCEELKEHMRVIFEKNLRIAEVGQESDVSKESERGIDYTNVKKKLIEKRRKDRESRVIAKEKTKLSKLKEEPEVLVGKAIQHLCKVDDDAEWFRAVVRDLVEIKNDPMNIEYNIIYDDYPEEVWTFPLLRDLKNGDLIIL